MKKAMSFLTGLVIAVSCMSSYCKTEVTSAVIIKYDSGEMAKNGEIVLNSTDIIKVSKSDTDSYLTFSNGERIFVMKNRPESENELNSIDAMYILFEEEDYIIKNTTENRKKLDCSTEIKYIIDCKDGKMTDATTGEKLTDMVDLFINFYVLDSKNEYVTYMYVDNNGIFIHQNLPENVVTIKQGDVDENNVIELDDITLLSQYFLKDIELSNIQILAGDADGNGETDVCDLALLKQYIMKDDVKLGAKS